MKQIDRIRNMNAEELAKWIRTKKACKCCTEGDVLFCKAYCVDSIKAWLESEVEE